MSVAVLFSNQRKDPIGNQVLYLAQNYPPFQKRRLDSEILLAVPVDVEVDPAVDSLLDLLPQIIFLDSPVDLFLLEFSMSLSSSVLL